MMNDIVGQTFFKINKSDDTIEFYSTNGHIYTMTHQQDCCEEVIIDDIVGDLNDLIGTPILKYSVQSEDGECDDGEKLWTFYKFATIKGYVDMRWVGTSNGYYSVSVNFDESKNNYLSEWRDSKLSDIVNIGNIGNIVK